MTHPGQFAEPGLLTDIAMSKKHPIFVKLVIRNCDYHFIREAFKKKMWISPQPPDPPPLKCGNTFWG